MTTNKSAAETAQERYDLLVHILQHAVEAGRVANDAIATRVKDRGALYALKWAESAELARVALGDAASKALEILDHEHKGSADPAQAIAAAAKAILNDFVLDSIKPVGCGALDMGGLFIKYRGAAWKEIYTKMVSLSAS